VYRRSDDGSVELVGGIGGWALLDPSRQWLVTDLDGLSTLALVDVVHGGRVDLDVAAPEQTCNVVDWIRTDALLAVCADLDLSGAQGPPRNVSLDRIDVADGAAHLTELKRFADDENIPDPWGNGAALADGRVALVMTEPALHGCDVGVSVWDDGALEPLQDADPEPAGSFVVAAVGASVYVQSAPSCHEMVPRVLTVHDLGTGTTTTLAPAPAPTGDVPRWQTGLRSWAVADTRQPTP
jgi:hypothetical protein